jgi:hypothetical protein
MQFKMWLHLVVGILPLVTGFLWYNPKTFANVWAAEAGINPANKPRYSMPVTVGLTYLFGVLASTVLGFLVIHQMSVPNVFQGSENQPEVKSFLENFFTNYGTNFRSFKHGVLHGVITALFFALPIIGMSAVYESKSFKYIFIHVGYWVVTLALMGGVLCAFM